MSAKQTRKVIQQAYDLIKDPDRWTTGMLSNGQGQYCALGAVQRVSRFRPRARFQARQLLDELADEMYGTPGIIALNDSYGLFAAKQSDSNVSYRETGAEIARQQVLKVMREAIRSLTSARSFPEYPAGGKSVAEIGPPPTRELVGAGDRK